MSLEVCAPVLAHPLQAVSQGEHPLLHGLLVRLARGGQRQRRHCFRHVRRVRLGRAAVARLGVTRLGSLPRALPPRGALVPHLGEVVDVGCLHDGRRGHRLGADEPPRQGDGGGARAGDRTPHRRRALPLRPWLHRRATSCCGGHGPNRQRRLFAIAVLAGSPAFARLWASRALGANLPQHILALFAPAHMHTNPQRSPSIHSG